MLKRIITAGILCLTLSQCDSIRKDCQAVAQREAEIAQEKPGDYYIGRRYYIPSTRFWGYLRKPGQSWRTAQLVIMDERTVRTPDRGYEPPVKNAIFGTDHNVEYIVHGKYTNEKAYDPSTNRILPTFIATKYQVRNRKPGFLFTPSEEYRDDYVTLRPAIMPTAEQCRRTGAQ